jgi:predicted Na+-dependent transporter
MGVLFAVGATCFALGSLPGYVEAVGVGADGLTFFVGSIFFTSAGYLQVRACCDGRLFAWRPRRAEWVAAVVQFVGTLFFNASTFHAMEQNLSASQANQLVWRPDAFGSICFLVASGIAWLCVAHAWFAWQPHCLAWWIAGLNLLGSIAFGVSAVASKVVPETDQVRSVTLMNLGTFIGALGFLIAAVLLLPERTEQGAAGGGEARAVRS